MLYFILFRRYTSSIFISDAVEDVLIFRYGCLYNAFRGVEMAAPVARMGSLFLMPVYRRSIRLLQIAAAIISILRPVNLNYHVSEKYGTYECT